MAQKEAKKKKKNKKRLKVISLRDEKYKITFFTADQRIPTDLSRSKPRADRCTATVD